MELRVAEAGVEMLITSNEQMFIVWYIVLERNQTPVETKDNIQYKPDHVPRQHADNAITVSNHHHSYRLDTTYSIAPVSFFHSRHHGFRALSRRVARSRAGPFSPSE